jgi:hypothetical protein
MNEWTTEGNRKHWVDSATGLDCLIVRNHLGALCGYVAVPEAHPWFGANYTELDDVDVHGGLTYCGACAGDVCHDAQKGDAVAHENVWWLGFDTAHYYDFVPGMPAFTQVNKAATYKNIAYMEAECTKLAAQVWAAAL